MKETYASFSNLKTTQSASNSFLSLMMNIEDKIGNKIIANVKLDKQINRLIVEPASTQRDDTGKPQVAANVENGCTKITIEPLYSVKAIDLCNAFNHIKEYMDYMNNNFSAAKIILLDVLDNRLELFVDREIDLSSLSISNFYKESSFGIQVDLFNFNEKLESIVPETDVSEGLIQDSTEDTCDTEETETQQEEKEEPISAKVEEVIETPSIENETLLIEPPVEEKEVLVTELEEEPLKEQGDVSLETTEEQKEEITEDITEDVEDSTLTVKSVPEEPQNKLMIIDGNNVLIRGYFATAHSVEESELQKDEEGNFINAIKVFLQQLERYISVYGITNLAICFDNNNPFLANFRAKLYPEYKGTRDEKPTALLQQLDSVQDVLKQMNIPQFMDPKGMYEADDLIGTILNKWRIQEDGPVYIVSNDKDLYQLLDVNVYQILKKGKDEIQYSLEDFQNEFGITPAQWIDAKAILGDTSDNIPGVSGVGDKYVYDMIKEYQSVENLYNNLNQLAENSAYKRYVSKFETQKKEAMLSKFLATIITHAKVEEVEQLNLHDLRLDVNLEGKKTVYQRVGLKNKNLVTA